tara:strand:- start:57 stop:416 length:360 start_codon:yes stop_codon:yes gene_type:complete
MNFREHLKWILSDNPIPHPSQPLNENPIPPTKQLDQFDYGQDGYETVVLTPEAPEELRDLAGEDGEVILVSVNPYKVKLKDGSSDEAFTVYPKDIVIEGRVEGEIKKYTRQYLNFILGK